MAMLCTMNWNQKSTIVCSIIDIIPISDIKLQQLIEAQDEDEVTKKVKEYCLEGLPEKH